MVFKPYVISKLANDANMELQNEQDVVNGNNFDGRGKSEWAQMPNDMDDNLVPRPAYDERR
jgi:hypothetical protein